MSYYQNFPEDRGSVGAGFGIGILLNAVQGGLLFLILNSAHAGLRTLIFGLGGWGLIQLIYMAPIYIYLRRTKRPDTAKGLLIAASLVLLINASCWGCFAFR